MRGNIVIPKKGTVPQASQVGYVSRSQKNGQRDNYLVSNRFNAL
jgi:hypothetical protein